MASDHERPVGLDGDPDRLHGSPVRMAFVVILTCVVMVFALLIALWMYWLGGQLPGASIPVS